MGRPRSIAALLVAGGCRIGFEPGAPDGGAGVRPDAAPFDDTGTFSAIVPVAELSTDLNNDDPMLSVDGLELWFTQKQSDAPPLGEIMRMTRATTTEPWSSPVRQLELGSDAWEGTPALTDDGLTLYMSREIQPLLYDLFVTTRATHGSAWATPVAIAELNGAAAHESGLFTRDGLDGWFTSDRSGTRDIWYTRRASATDAWQAPVVRADLSSPDLDQHPWLSPDGLVVYFTSDRPGGAGGRDIWRATRTATDQLFAAPTPVTELNTADDDYDAWLSVDGKTVYFVSLRDGDYDLFVASR